MTARKARRDPVAVALVFGDVERRLDELCKRLGIASGEPELIKWARIGMALARDEPEFSGKPRRRGRPSKALFDQIDVQRALVIDEIQRLVLVKGNRPTAKLIVLKAMEGNYPESRLFPSRDGLQPTLNSISRGRAQLKRLDAELKTARRGGDQE